MLNKSQQKEGIDIEVKYQEVGYEIFAFFLEL